jgi:hypothetical protein
MDENRYKPPNYEKFYKKDINQVPGKKKGPFNYMKWMMIMSAVLMLLIFGISIGMQFYYQWRAEKMSQEIMDKVQQNIDKSFSP